MWVNSSNEIEWLNRYIPRFQVADEKVDARLLTEQLGSADELTTLSPTACCHQLTKIHSLPALRDFLRNYTHEVLGPHEFRHIFESHKFANQNFTRELLALDTQVSKESVCRNSNWPAAMLGNGNSIGCAH
jgi:hypothetical protein